MASCMRWWSRLRRGVACGTLAERVDAELGAEILRHRHLVRFEWNARRIGDPVDGVEEGGDPGRVGEGLGPHRVDHRLTGSGDPVEVRADHGFGEGGQDARVGNAAFVAGRAQDGAQIVGLTSMIAARTEQCHMAGRSIDALVEGGDPARDQLDLGVGDGAELPVEVAHLVAAQI